MTNKEINKRLAEGFHTLTLMYIDMIEKQRARNKEIVESMKGNKNGRIVFRRYNPFEVSK
jgi:hypothetical protein